MNYDERMDPQCFPLCDAINAIPGLTTSESCCGHGKAPFRIWFHAKRIRDLYVLVRCIDNRYGGIRGWSCQVEDCDLTERPVIFLVCSGESKGPKSYLESRRIADSIQGFLHNKKFMKMFHIPWKGKP
jgi:hypothetical protein